MVKVEALLKQFIYFIFIVFMIMFFHVVFYLLVFVGHPVLNHTDVVCHQGQQVFPVKNGL